jgi:hypothetical protein
VDRAGPVEVTGEFTDLAAPPAGAPVLLVRGAEGTHRLPALPESLSDVPEEGRPWRAEFSWEVAPTPFDAAAIEFGHAILVELGCAKPHRRRPRDARARHRWRRPPATLPPAGSGAERLHPQSEMLVLAVESFAQEAPARERSAAQQLGTDLEQAREAVSEARAALVALRERLVELERSGEEAAQTRAGPEQAVAETQRTRADSERLPSRIARIREGLDYPV